MIAYVATDPPHVNKKKVAQHFLGDDDACIA